MSFAPLAGAKKPGAMGYGTRIKETCKGGFAEIAATDFQKNHY